MLKQMGLTMNDWVNQPYDAGLPVKVLTFQPTPGLDRDTILETVRPTVIWKDRLLQSGEVIVGTPVVSEGEDAMSRATIEYGIDLGTTNSTIAVVAGTATEVIKNALDADITPSAVYINREGNLWVGQNARSKLADERAEDDVFLEFKRRMGTGYEYRFRASGRRMSPEQLSAEVLKSLRGDVVRTKGEEISAAVLTVPAAFELHQCDATKRAAELAGFRTSLLLQEPVAAALAYGHQRMDSQGLLAGLRLRRRHIRRGADPLRGRHDGGGQPRRRRLPGRFRHRLGDRGAGARPAGEGAVRVERFRARVRRASNTIFCDSRLRRRPRRSSCRTRSRPCSRPRCAAAPPSRSRLRPRSPASRSSRIAGPIVMKAVNIAQRVLTEKGLSPAAVEKMIFVGGPTLAPYFRELVKEQLAHPVRRRSRPAHRGGARSGDFRRQPAAGAGIRVRTIDGDPALDRVDLQARRGGPRAADRRESGGAGGNGAGGLYDRSGEPAIESGGAARSRSRRTAPSNSPSARSGRCRTNSGSSSGTRRAPSA